MDASRPAGYHGAVRYRLSPPEGDKTSASTTGSPAIQGSKGGVSATEGSGSTGVRSDRGRSERRSALLRSSRTVFSLLCASLLCASCSAGRGSTLVAIDAAFGTIHPGLSSSISRLDTAGKLPARAIPGGMYTLERGPKALAGDIAAARGRKRDIGVIVASALVAARTDILPEGIPLIVVDGPSPTRLLTYAVRGDRAAAYREAGKAAGIYLASLALTPLSAVPEKPGLSPAPLLPDRIQDIPAGIPENRKDLKPACGIVFSPGFARPESLIAEFEAGYRIGYLSAAPKSGAPDGEPQAPVVEKISTAGAQDPSKSTVDFIDFTGETESAVNRLLRRNVRLIFFACGRIQEASRTAATHPKIIVGLDETLDAAVPGMAFRIIPDEARLARSVRAMRNSILSGRKPPEAGITVPATLVPGTAGGARPEAASFAAALKRARKTR